MSMPTIPDINPNIDISREEAINILLASIGLEEMAIAELMKAESLKLKEVLKCTCDPCKILEINKSIESIIKSLLSYETILQTKLRDVMEFDSHYNPSPCHKEPCPKYSELEPCHCTNEDWDREFEVKNCYESKHNYKKESCHNVDNRIEPERFYSVDEDWNQENEFNNCCHSKRCHEKIRDNQEDEYKELEWWSKTDEDLNIKYEYDQVNESKRGHERKPYTSTREHKELEWWDSVDEGWKEKKDRDKKYYNQGSSYYLNPTVFKDNTSSKPMKKKNTSPHRHNNW